MDGDATELNSGAYRYKTKLQEDCSEEEEMLNFVKKGGSFQNKTVDFPQMLLA